MVWNSKLGTVICIVWQNWAIGRLGHQSKGARIKS